jgi:hypothetical protein
LSREEQAKYYEKARQERQLHMQLYPGWSARDNYGYGTKKKKRKKEKSVDGGTAIYIEAAWLLDWINDSPNMCLCCPKITTTQIFSPYYDPPFFSLYSISPSQYHIKKLELSRAE